MDELKNFGCRPKSYHNEEFLNSVEARNIRILCELTEPKKIFAEEQIENTVVFFGSARSIPLDVAEKNLRKVEHQINDDGIGSHHMHDEWVKAQTDFRLAKYYECSRELAAKLTNWSKEIVQKEKRFLVCTGGGPGMMEGANRGASEAGGKTIGLNISLPMEQSPNPYQTEGLAFEYHYFFVRKFWFAYLAKALVVMPGGFGTMDELFEILTLIQTRKLTKPMPIVLFGKEFWDDLLNFDAMTKWGVIDKEDLKLFQIFDDVDEAFEYLKEELIKLYL